MDGESLERNFENNIEIINPEQYEKEYYLFKIENKDSNEDCKITLNDISIIKCESCDGDLTKHSITLGFSSVEHMENVISVFDTTYDKLVSTLYERRDEWFNGFDMNEIKMAFSPLYKNKNELSLVVDFINSENIIVNVDTNVQLVCNLDGILFFDGDFQANKAF